MGLESLATPYHRAHLELVFVYGWGIGTNVFNPDDEIRLTSALGERF